MASKVWVSLLLSRGDPIRVGYASIEVQGGHNVVRGERGVVWAKKTKTEPWRLSFG